VVDDEFAARSALAAELRSVFEVIVAPGIEEARGLLDGRNDVVAVIVDLIMWGPIDGYDLLEWMRIAAPRCARVLVSSVSQGEWYVQNGVAQQFVHKPWSAGEVLAAVRGLTRM
jgi:DNA-binding response OmpR family regulator